MSLSNFALKKVSVCSFTKCVLQSSPGLVQMKWRLDWECMQPSRFLNRRNFWSGSSTKKELMSLSNFALKKVSVCSFTKFVLQSSQELVQIQLGLEWECMYSSSLLNRRNFWSGLSTKKELMSLSNFALKKVSVCSLTKNVLQSSRGLVQMKWGLDWECIQPSRFLNRRNFWSGSSTKKELMSLSNFELKKVSVCRFTKCVLQSSPGLVQMKWRLDWEFMQPSRFLNRKNFWSGSSTKKELMSLSNFALKKVSVCSFTKFVLPSSQELVQIKWGLE